MDYLFHNTPNIAITFGKIEGTESGGCLVEMCVRFELVGGKNVRKIETKETGGIQLHGSVSAS